MFFLSPNQQCQDTEGNSKHWRCWRCGSSDHRHKEVWVKLVAASSHRAALARCTRASHIQARRHDVQLSTWSSAAVPAWLLPSSLWCHITASSLICWLMTDVCTASEEEYICPAGFLYGWPVGVEFAAGLPERPDNWQRHFCKHPNIFLFAVYWYIQRIRSFRTMRFINLHFVYLLLAFSALTLLVGRQEGYPACKKMDGGGGHWLVWLEWRPARWLVSLPLLIFPCTIKSRSSLLAPAHPVGPGKRAVKQMWWCYPNQWSGLVFSLSTSTLLRKGLLLSLCHFPVPILFSDASI